MGLRMDGARNDDEVSESENCDENKEEPPLAIKDGNVSDSGTTLQLNPGKDNDGDEDGASSAAMAARPRVRVMRKRPAQASDPKPPPSHEVEASDDCETSDELNPNAKLFRPEVEKEMAAFLDMYDIDTSKRPLVHHDGAVSKWGQAGMQDGVVTLIATSAPKFSPSTIVAFDPCP